MKVCFVLVLMTLCLASSGQSTNDSDEFRCNRRLVKTSQTFIPKNGFVPDKDTAIAIAYAVAVPVYGKKQVDWELPFRTELKDGVWMVLGTLHCDSCAGGTLVVEIEKDSGRVIHMTHTM